MDKYSLDKPYKVIALCLAKFTGYDQENLIKELCNRCSKYNIKVMIFSTLTAFYDDGPQDQGEGQIFQLFEPARFDAVVVMAETFYQSKTVDVLVERSKKAGVPVISVDREIEGCINIVFNYDNAFEMIVRHIVEGHGLKHVNFIAGYKGNPFSEARLNIYKHVLEKNNIPVEEERIGYGDFWAEPTKAVVENFLNSDLEFPEAIICANDIMAIECVRSLKMKGFRIPEDVIVTGFDGVELERFYSPRLTTAEFDLETLCETILHIVCCGEREINKAYQKTTIIPYRFRMGASCGCVMLQSEDVEEKLYQEKFIIDDQEFFQSDMFNMVSDITRLPDLKDAFPKLPSYYERAYPVECWVCFNKNFLASDHNVAWNFDRNDHHGQEYTDTIRVALHSIGRKQSELMDCKREDLLPDIDKVLRRADYMMFVPIHLQGYTIGYMANTFLLDKFRAKYYMCFLQNFKHILDTYASRAMLERLYVYDVLTSVYNRRGFYRYIAGPFAESKQNEQPFTLISIDMDGLKYINDTFGHAEGDFSIHKIGEAMLSVTKETEICTRFGGDEFLIGFLDEMDSNRAQTIVKDIEGYLETVNTSAGKPYEVRASYGIYTGIVSSETSLDDYIKNADALMYENKKERKAARS